MLSRPGLSLACSVGNETALRFVLPDPAVTIVMGRSILWETATSNSPWRDCVRKKNKGGGMWGTPVTGMGACESWSKITRKRRGRGVFCKSAGGGLWQEGITKGTGEKRQRGFMGACSRVEKQWTCWKGICYGKCQLSAFFSALKCNLLGKNETVF